MVFRVCLLCSHILWHHYQYKVHDIPLPAEFNDYNLGDHLSEELLELVKKGDNEIEFFPKWFRDVESPDEADVFIPLYVGGYVEVFINNHLFIHSSIITFLTFFLSHS